MRVELSQVAGVSLELVSAQYDHRGSFIKLADERLTVDQVCVSRNDSAGTLRGLHYQIAPNDEHKLVWCSAGVIFDVVVDLRPEQPTYGAWASVVLSATDPHMLRIPPGVAHGFQTMVDKSDVTYLIRGPHSPESARRLRWDDRHLDIRWPQPDPTAMSAADMEAPPWPPRA
jgi:dTDP-4-dehydrorhamnose 3,5-epimerase